MQAIAGAIVIVASAMFGCTAAMISNRGDSSLLGGAAAICGVVGLYLISNELRDRNRLQKPPKSTD
jgi:hypothetical protein